MLVLFYFLFKDPHVALLLRMTENPMATGTYSYKNIWRVAYPILISLVMEQMIGLTDSRKRHV